MNKLQHFFKVYRFIYILLLLSLTIILYNSYIINNNKKTIFSLSTNNIRLKNLVYTYSINDSLKIINDNNQTYNKVQLTNLKGEKVSLNNIIYKPTIILFFDKYSCGSCIKNEIEIIKETISKLKKVNFIIITDFDDKGQLFRFMKINNLDEIEIFLDTYNNFNILKYFNDLPYYFVLDLSLTIKHLYLPNKELGFLTTRYFRLVDNNYSINNTF